LREHCTSRLIERTEAGPHSSTSSDSIPRRRPNNAKKRAEHTAEVEEGRELAKGKTVEQNRVRTQRRSALQRALNRMRAAARKDRAMPLTALWHQVYDIDRLREAYYGVNRDASPGSNGQTWAT
jgi:RNA-directed DNA polymerase